MQRGSDIARASGPPSALVVSQPAFPYAAPTRRVPYTFA